MRVFIIDTTHMSPELQRGLIGVVGSSSPSPEEKKECVDTVSRYAVDGWAIAADPHTPIGHLAALTAETACVPFVRLDGARLAQRGARTIGATRNPERDFVDFEGLSFPASALGSRADGIGSVGSRSENGGL